MSILNWFHTQEEFYYIMVPIFPCAQNEHCMDTWYTGTNKTIHDEINYVLLVCV
jgi:hypothetical protein